MARLAAHPAAGGVLVHASAVNSALATGDGGCCHLVALHTLLLYSQFCSRRLQRIQYYLGLAPLLFLCMRFGPRLKLTVHAAPPPGIDVCGRRVAEEVRAVVAAHPSLQEVSFVGHRCV